MLHYTREEGGEQSRAEEANGPPRGAGHAIQTCRSTGRQSALTAQPASKSAARKAIWGQGNYDFLLHLHHITLYYITLLQNT